MRICARSGCNSPATATLSYDRIALVAYLVTADDPAAREPGDLCERHVARLVLPRQWQLDDRRTAAAVATPPPAPKAKAATRAKKLRVVPGEAAAKPRPTARPKRARAAKPAKWTEVGPSLFDAPAEPVAALTPPVDTADAEPVWMPRFGPETDDDVLDAKTPLLRRAFGGQ